MKHVIFALGLATAALTFAGQSQAVVVAHHDYTPENAGASSAVIVPVSPGKKVGFVTCGKRFGWIASLGCKDYDADGNPTIPWTAFPGYRLGSQIPASYRVTGVAVDSYNQIATVYFEY